MKLGIERVQCVNSKAVDAFNEDAILADEHDILADEHDILADKHDTLADKHDTLADKHDALADKHDTLADEHDTLVDKHGTLVDKHDTLGNKARCESTVNGRFLHVNPKEKADKNLRYRCGGKVFDLGYERAMVPHLGRPE